jgi:hypothetical protein
MKMLCLLGLSILFLPATATAFSDSVNCPAGYPCIYDVFISTTNALVLKVDTNDYDVVQVRWSRPGREGDQREFAGRRGLRNFTVLTSTTPGAMYKVSVNGCNRRTLQSSVCSGWTSMSRKAY